jgi:hypothetical protein
MLKKLHCGLVKFLELYELFFLILIYLIRVASGISRIDGDDEDEDFGTNNDEEWLRSGRFGWKPRGIKQEFVSVFSNY